MMRKMDEEKNGSSETRQGQITYISWAEYCSRSDNTARELAGTSHMVYLGALGSNPFTILFKYLGQFVMTMRILWREKPRAVFVMSPPVIAVLPAYVYKLLTGTPFVIDAHTAAFLHPRWKHFQWLQHWLGRRAATTIVTNDHLAEYVQKNGGHTTIIRDVPIVYEGTETYPLNGRFTVAVVCSFNYDEPIEAIYEAAAQLPDVRFYMTGNPKDLDPAIAAKKPENVTLTGFLSDEAYGSLISNAGAVMTLTTRDHTMLRGAYEAIYQGTPVIVSDWKMLREAFDDGAVHVDNSVEQIVAAVNEMQVNHKRYKEGALKLMQRKHERWQRTKEQLLARIGR